jgi:hypothetical protein
MFVHFLGHPVYLGLSYTLDCDSFGVVTALSAHRHGPRNIVRIQT